MEQEQIPKEIRCPNCGGTIRDCVYADLEEEPIVYHCERCGIEFSSL